MKRYRLLRFVQPRLCGEPLCYLCTRHPANCAVLSSSPLGTVSALGILGRLGSQELVGGGGSAAALRNGPHHQALATAAVAGGKDAVDGGGKVAVLCLEVGARVQLNACVFGGGERVSRRGAGLRRSGGGARQRPCGAPQARGCSSGPRSPSSG